MEEFSDFLLSSVAGVEFHDTMENLEDFLIDSDKEDDDEEALNNPPPEPFTATPMQLLPPPTGKPFPTLTALLRAVNLHAAEQGYAVAKAGCKKNRNGDVRKN